MNDDLKSNGHGSSGRGARSNRKWPHLLAARLLFALLVPVFLNCGPAGSPGAPSAREQSLLDVQRGINSGLEAEIANLRNALNADVCAAREALGTSPKDRKATPPPGPAGQAPAARTVGDLMEQATVMVLCPRPKGVSTGTGFFVAPGKVVTNRHVVGDNPEKIFVVNKALGGIKKGVVTVISQEPDRDYALISVELTDAGKIPSLSLKDSVKRMDRVSAWGFPGMVTSDDPKFKALMSGDLQAVPEVVYTEGVVSVVLDHAVPLVVHTALISHGNSGGPLVDENGTVVGINTYINLDSKSYRQSCMSIAGKDLIAFLNTNGIPITVAAAKP
jgi:S1-C subfamily serine protease